MGSLSGLPVEDEKWTDSLIKICILSSEFPEDFDDLRKRILDQYSYLIEFGLRRMYRLMIDDNNILRSFKEGRG
jgi:hypothetical protein